jgi:hypothetical protein
MRVADHLQRMLRHSLCVWVVLSLAGSAFGRDPGDPIRLQFIEGDLAGFTSIHAADAGGVIGRIEYHQRRRDALLETVRTARFADGSSDEDQAVARIADGLVAVRGRSLLRDASGEVVVDLEIDVEAGRLRGFYRDGAGQRVQFDDAVSLPPGTYWGALVFLVVKNFAANAVDDRVRFVTVAPTPQPRVLTMEIVAEGSSVLSRPGGVLDVQRYMLRPLVNRIVDPLLRIFLPPTEFLVEPGSPPALARYEGPRNYAGQEIRLE